MSDDGFRPPRQSRQLLGSLIAAAVLVLGTVGIASANVNGAASCADDHGGSSSGHGSGG